MIVRAYLVHNLQNISGTGVFLPMIIFTCWMTIISFIFFLLPSIFRKISIKSEKKRKERQDKFNPLKGQNIEGAPEDRDIGKLVDEQFSQPENRVKI